MTASVLKQDPNTKRFKRTLIYFIHANNLPSSDQAVKTQPKQDKSFSFIVFDRLSFV